MSLVSVAVSGSGLQFPSWGRSFWQDPNDGRLICLYASGTQEVDYIESADSGNTWSAPQFAFPIDDFSTYNNFDTSMDRVGHVHCVHRYNGSGCYTVLGKTVGSGWAPSGTIARGFFDGRSGVASKDFNGSIEVYDVSLALFGDPATPPAARIIAVDSGNTVKSFYVNSPYTGWPVSQGEVSPVDVGPSGGFPIVTDAGDFGSLATVFTVSPPTGMYYRQTVFGTWANSINWPNPIDVRYWQPEFEKENGQVGDVPFGPNMAWCRTDIGKIFPILTSINNPGRFELWTTSAEPLGVGQFFGRADSLQGSGLLAVNRISPDELTFKNFINNIAGADAAISGGVPVDISTFDAADEFGGGGPSKSNVNFYFLQRRLNGDQTIFRIKASVEKQFGGDTASKTRYIFGALDDGELGIKSWADVSISNGGAGSSGLPNIVYWHGLKVPRTPVAPSGARREIVATIGRGIDGSGLPVSDSYIYMWPFDESLSAGGGTLLPTHVTEYTADSGGQFTGIASVSGITNAVNLFDGSTATSGQIANNATITLEFSEPLTFNRIEVLWNSPPSGFFGIDIESSFDNSTYEQVYSLPSGTPGASPSLVKITAENDPLDLTQPTVSATMDGFAGKYVRLTFNSDDPTTRDVREIKLYGAHSTKGFISTSGWESELINVTRESFRFAPTGLPVGWRTYGDFEWFVDNGIHQSGFFSNDTIGSGDLYAVRTDRNPPINSSGVLETDVVVDTPRDVSFILKWDFQGNIFDDLDPNDPADDYLYLYVQTPTGLVDYTSALYAPFSVTPFSWRQIDIVLSEPGLNTIQWVYRRGNKEAGAPAHEGEAAVWIDWVAGLDPVPNSPNLLTTLWAYVNGGPPIAAEQINAWASGSQAYSENINAWMSGLFESPNQGINAYHAGEFAATGNFYGYLPSIEAYHQSYGFIEGAYATPTGAINGYMVNSGAFDMLYGHMQNKLNEAINGFLLGPSGALDSINAYMFTPHTLAINGYMQVEDKTQIQVNAYLNAFGIGDQINGYMLGSGLNTQSYGYIKADGALDAINAYMKTGDNQALYGYLQGIADATGVINAWMSGIGAMSQAINSYIMGISGVPTGVINGFIEAVELPDGSINAYVIGFDGSGACNFPTPTLSTPTIPTGNFFT